MKTEEETLNFGIDYYLEFGDLASALIMKWDRLATMQSQ